MADDSTSWQLEISQPVALSFGEVSSLNDKDLVEKFSKLRKNVSAKARPVSEYHCKLLSNCAFVSSSLANKNPKQSMLRHLRGHLKELEVENKRQRQNTSLGLGGLEFQLGFFSFG